MVERIDVIDRAKRALDYDLPFPGDTIGVPKGHKGHIDAAGRIVKEILEAEEVVRQEERLDIGRKLDRIIELMEPQRQPLSSALLEQELDTLEEELRDGKITHEEFKKECRISEENYVEREKLLGGKDMPAHSFVGGYPVWYDNRRKVWRYLDNNIDVEKLPRRPCPKCKVMPTVDGYDACLGYIPGAVAACCGHGVEEGYIEWKDKDL